MRNYNILILLLAVIPGGVALYQLSPMNEGIDRAGNETGQAAISTDYADLVSLFREFRAFQQGESGNSRSYSQSGWILSTADDTPDFSAAAMAEKFHDLRAFQGRLEAMDPTDWTIPQQADYHLIRAEMNGQEFQHRVLSPWSRDPGFYNDVIAMLPEIAAWPLEENEMAVLRSKIRSIPAVVEQAKENLDDFSEVASDAATLAVLSLGDTRTSYASLADSLTTHHPELVTDVESALTAIDDYEDWIQANQPRMTGRAGVGKENYNWLLRNVYLIPYTWEDIRTIVELEDNRVIA